MSDASHRLSAPAGLARAVGRWQILGLSINSVVGSGVYLLPATAFALLGPFSVWGVLAAGLTVSLLVLCYAEAASRFEQQGGSALYAQEAFGPFAGFQIGWATWLTRVATAASLSNGLADAVARFWPVAGTGAGRTAIIAGSLLLLGAINIVGVRRAAQLSLALVFAKLLPLLLFVCIGVFHVDWALAFGAPAAGAIDLRGTGEAALLLLFAYAGFENLSVAAGEYRNPRRNVPFALVAMIVLVTLLYAAVQLVAQGTLPAWPDRPRRWPMRPPASAARGWRCCSPSARRCRFSVPATRPCCWARASCTRWRWAATAHARWPACTRISARRISPSPCNAARRWRWR